MGLLGMHASCKLKQLIFALKAYCHPPSSDISFVQEDHVVILISDLPNCLKPKLSLSLRAQLIRICAENLLVNVIFKHKNVRETVFRRGQGSKFQYSESHVLKYWRCQTSNF